MTINNFNIDFDKINLCGWKDKEESFENLCKEFLMLKYKITENVNLIKWYPAIECPVVLWDKSIYYGFQSKLKLSKNTLNEALEDSFWDKKNNKCKMNKDDFQKIKTLVIFSNKERTNQTEDKLNAWIKKDHIKIEFRCGKNFISELQKDEFVPITVRYFNNQELRAAFHKNNKQQWKIENIWDVRKYQIVKDHENAFDWAFIKQDEKDLAKEFQEHFLVNKWMYCDTPSLKIFMELEKKIRDAKFRGLELSLKWRASPDVEWVLEKFRDELFKPSWLLDENDEVDIKAYIPESEHIKWLLINYWAEWYCKIASYKEKEVRFISKTWDSWIQTDS